MRYANLRHELINHLKVYNTASYLFLFLLFTSVCMVFILPQNLISELAAAQLLIIIPIAQISNTAALFQQDYKDGTLEFKLATTSADNIAITKYIGLNLVSLMVILIIMPLFCLLYTIDYYDSLKLCLIYILMLSYINAFTVLVSSIQVYFGSACNFIATLVFPLIIPGIICGVLSLKSAEIFSPYIKLLVGLNLILVPIILMMVSYLVRNIYNMSE